MDYITGFIKVIAKAGLNIVAPGSSTFVDFVEATYSFTKGDYLDAGITVAFGVLDLLTLGIASSAKNTGQEVVKGCKQKAIKEAKKKIGQEAGFKIGQEILRSKAKEDALKEGAKAMAKQQAKEQGQKFLKKQTLKFGKETGVKIAKERAARKAFKSSAVKLAKELGENTKQCIQAGIVNATEQAISDATSRSFTKALVNDFGHKIVQNGIKVPTCKDVLETITSNVLSELKTSATKEFEKTFITDKAYKTTYEIAKSSLKKVQMAQVGTSVAGGIVRKCNTNE